MNLPSLTDVRSAAACLDQVAHRTPVLTSSRLDAQLGRSVFVKCENFQRMGAFKFRGAYYAMSKLDPAQRSAGVVAYSSGNHAQAIALAGRLLGIPTTIVMPADAPQIKLDATRGYGAKVVTFDRLTEDREEIGARLAAEGGLTLIPPYNHYDVIAGQGTVALELFEQAPQLDTVLAPMGGGGLVGGLSIAASGQSPGTQVFGVEPQTGDDAKRSLEQGSIVHIDVPDTIADGVRTQHLGDLTFAVAQQYLAGVLTVSDDQIVSAMKVLASSFKIVVEPTAALGLAALMARPEQVPGARVGIVVSGGNVDLRRFAELLS
ncbi:threo-3-hydroxy-L-aspartate ammonia-lyase [Dermacoccaceae bacterium W4C1]